MYSGARLAPVFRARLCLTSEIKNNKHTNKCDGRFSLNIYLSILVSFKDLFIIMLNCSVLFQMHNFNSDIIFKIFFSPQYSTENACFCAALLSVYSGNSIFLYSFLRKKPSPEEFMVSYS